MKRLIKKSQSQTTGTVVVWEEIEDFISNSKYKDLLDTTKYKRNFNGKNATIGVFGIVKNSNPLQLVVVDIYEFVNIQTNEYICAIEVGEIKIKDIDKKNFDIIMVDDGIFGLYIEEKSMAEIINDGNFHGITLSFEDKNLFKDKVYVDYFGL